MATPVVCGLLLTFTGFAIMHYVLRLPAVASLMIMAFLAWLVMGIYVAGMEHRPPGELEVGEPQIPPVAQ